MRRSFEEALRLHESSNRPWDEARTELLYGEYLRRTRRRIDARTHLRRSAEVFQALGAGAWTERAQGELRATGETTPKRDLGAAGGLSPQEYQIVNLVTSGSSNRDIAAQLFLSPRTVEYHLSKVYAKLGLSSRAELRTLQTDALPGSSSYA